MRHPCLIKSFFLLLFSFAGNNAHAWVYPEHVD